MAGARSMLAKSLTGAVPRILTEAQPRKFVVVAHYVARNGLKRSPR
jgi:hypothetical protein